VGGRWRTIPLFTGYSFARIEETWRPIERAIGVSGIVKFGAAPAKVPDPQIAILIARSDSDGVVRLAPRPTVRTLAPGARVLVTDGVFRGFDAIYAGMAAHDREKVLLSILGAPREVEVAGHLLAAWQ
jgi:transcription antitermination factor NusG